MNNHNIASSEPQLTFLSKAIRASLIGFALAHGSAQAATIEVTSTNDPGLDSDGLCTFREAITSLNGGVVGLTDCVMTGAAAGTDDSITFAASLNPTNSTITLYGSHLAVGAARDITVAGAGITVDANDESRVFAVTSSRLALDNINLTGGFDVLGGGMLAQSASNIVLSNCSVSGNTAASSGGAIHLRNSSTVSLSNCSISNNSAANRGGGIYGPSASIVNADNSRISGNISGHDGGGVYAKDDSILTVTSSTISGNSSDNHGGGIAVSNATANLTNSTISSNSTSDDGGGIFATFSKVNLTDSTVSGNSADLGGGILAQASAELNLVNSTLSGNTANFGGGVDVQLSASSSLNNSTISANSANFGGGVYIKSSGQITFNNSIVAGNTSPRGADINANSSSTLTTDRNNLFGHAGLTLSEAFEGAVDFGPTDIVATSDAPGIGAHVPTALSSILQSLTHNGGTTKTHALAAASPARDAAKLTDPNGCPTTDQRGQLRDDGDGFCDIGAFEFNSNDDTTFFVIPLSNNGAVVIPN